MSMKAFCEELERQYELRNQVDPEFAYLGSEEERSATARRIAIGLTEGKEYKRGLGVLETCRELGIRHSNDAIQEFLCAE